MFECLTIQWLIEEQKMKKHIIHADNCFFACLCLNLNSFVAPQGELGTSLCFQTLERPDGAYLTLLRQDLFPPILSTADYSMHAHLSSSFSSKQPLMSSHGSCCLPVCPALSCPVLPCPEPLQPVHLSLKHPAEYGADNPAGRH